MDVVATAVELARNHGLHLFPCHEDKTPATSRGFKDASNDPDVVATLFKRGGKRLGLWPGPSGMVVVDIDVKDGATGEEEWHEMSAGLDLHPPEVLTPSGGRHLYFFKPEGTTFSNAKPSASIDIRADAGYVLFPTPGSGYEWETSYPNWCELCGLAHHDLGYAPIFPPTLIETLERSRIKAAEPAADDDPIPSGARYATLFQIGSKMAYQGVPEAGIREALLITNKERCKPPHTDQHVIKIVKSIIKSPPINPETGETRAGVGATRMRMAEQTVAPLDWAETWDKEQERVSWLPGLEGLAIEGRITNLYGPAGVGKSEILLQRSVVAAQRGVKVLWLDREMTEQDAKERLQDMGYEPKDLENLIYYLYPPLAWLDTAEGGNDLVEMALQAKAQVVVLDSLSKFVKGDEQDSGTATNFYVHSMLALKEKGIASVTIDHAGKDITRGARGTSAKKDNVDLYMEITRITGVGTRLTTGKQRHSWVKPTYTYRRSTDPIRYLIGTMCVYCKQPAITQKGDYYLCEEHQSV